MKKPAVLFFILIFLRPLATASPDLQNIYKSGEITARPVLTISSENLPDEHVFKNISGFLVLTDRRIVIADMYQHQVVFFSENGEFEKIIKSKGSGPGDIYYPGLMAANSRFLLVWEYGNRRFSVFTHQGEFVRHVRLKTKSHVMPQKMVTLKNNGFLFNYVRWERKETISQISVVQRFTGDLEEGGILCTHPHNTDKFILNNKMRVNIPLPFVSVLCWDVTPDEKLVLGFQKEYKIHFANIRGTMESFFTHTAKPAAVTDTDKEKFFKSITYMGRAPEGMPVELRKHVVFPEFKPCYSQILVDPQGNILVFPYAEADPEQSNYFDAFTADGKFVRRVKIGGEIISPRSGRFFKNCLWSVTDDEEGEQILVKLEWGGQSLI